MRGPKGENAACGLERNAPVTRRHGGPFIPRSNEGRSPLRTADLVERRLDGRTPAVRLREEPVNHTDRPLREPAFAEFLVTQGVETMVGTPEEFTEFMRKDRAYAGEIVKRFNIPKQ